MENRSIDKVKVSRLEEEEDLGEDDYTYLQESSDYNSDDNDKIEAIIQKNVQNAYLKEQQALLEIEHGEKPKLASTNYRWLVLIFAAQIQVGLYFCFDIPAVLFYKLQEVLEINKLETEYFYSVYSYPNLLIPLFMGFLMDKVGLNKIMTMLMVFLCVGQGLFTIGCMHESRAGFIWCIIGRVFMGIGGESIGMCQSVVLARWFKEKEFGFTLGLAFSISCIGLVANNLIEPPIANATSLGTASLVGLCVMGYTLLMVLVVVMLNKRAERVDAENGIEVKDEVEEVKCRDVFNLGINYWVACIMTTYLFSTILAFNTVANDFYSTRYGLNEERAAQLTAIPSVMGILLGPVFGILCDKFKVHIPIAMCSGLFLTSCQVLYVMVPSCIGCYNGLIPTAVIGLGYSMFISSTFAVFPYIVNENILGTAYGFITILTNINLSIAPLIIGLIQEANHQDKIQGFVYVSYFLMGIAGVGWLAAMTLYPLVRRGKVFQKVQVLEEKEQPIHSIN